MAITTLTRADLIEFETSIAAVFNQGQIRAPVHLSDGNEEQLLAVFADIRPEDWVLCSWRSHYHCLLKGVPMEAVRQEILAGRSIALCFPEYRVLSSAIVGGVVPIATGLGLAARRQGGSERIYCFVGEMTAETGIVHECVKYTRNHDLPVTFIIEDNGRSVCTDTRAAWGCQQLTYEGQQDRHVSYYRYESRYPHAGAGVRVQF